MKLINPLIILRILSTILFIESVTCLLCIPVAHIYSESPFPFLWSSLGTILISVVFYFIARDTDIQHTNSREGIMAVTLSWFALTFFGIFPYFLSGSITSFSDAFFESASGFSTTGSTIFADVESLPRSVLFWRSLTQWIGGLGIIVLVIIILPSLRITGHQLLRLESSLKEKIHPRTKSIGYRLFIIYSGLTLAEIFFLSLGDMDLFESTCHSLCTVATGGFSIKNTGMLNYSPYSQYIIGIFMFLSGISLVVYYNLLKFNLNKVKRNDEFWFYLIVTVISGVLVTTILFVNTGKPVESAFREGFFQVISIITTTGFTTTDFLLWPSTAVFMLFILMFTGACTGSTTGNIKMARHLIILKSIKNVFIRLVHPKAIYQVRLNEKPLTENMNISIISFVVMYIFIFIAGTILIILTGMDPVTAASASATSLGNIGPGLGTIGPMSNFSQITWTAKLVLSLLMIIGRLEILAVFTIFTRSYWRV
jgi:trk system potassium uptake protein TrkH